MFFEATVTLTFDHLDDHQQLISESKFKLLILFVSKG